MCINPFGMAVPLKFVPNAGGASAPLNTAVAKATVPSDNAGYSANRSVTVRCLAASAFATEPECPRGSAFDLRSETLLSELRVASPEH